jgi:hypothetical protein
MRNKQLLNEDTPLELHVCEAAHNSIHSAAQADVCVCTDATCQPDMVVMQPCISRTDPKILQC